MLALGELGVLIGLESSFARYRDGIVYTTMMWFLLTFVMMVCATVSSQHLSPVTVNTRVGPITGIQEHLRLYGENYKLNIFRGIPYAEPPVGKLRFKRSVPKARFQNGFNATAYGNACTQGFLVDPLHFPTRYPNSEDCLFLNVFAPVSATPTNKKPVMVFIHGGAWMIGASQEFDGRPLAAYGDVVMVTINYRLGPFGYLSTNDSNAPGNNALFDELLALHWVKDNIGEFGGDADTVTLFGQSAGGIETSFHAISPLSAGKGLFKRAIVESGTVIFPFPKHFTIFRNPLKKTKLLAGFLGCPNKTNHQTMIECMQTKSARDVLENGMKVLSLFPVYVWGPTIDGDFVPQLPFDLFSNPNISAFSSFSSIDLMIGATSADGDVDGASQFVHHGKKPSIPKPKLVDILTKQMMVGVPNEAGVVKAVLQEYVPSVEITGVEGMHIVVDFFTDFTFVGPTVSTAQTHAKMSKDAKTYLYFFDYALNKWTHSPFRPGLVTHCGELLYIFLFPSLDIDNGALRKNVTEKDIQLSKEMMTYWTNFAKYGNPNGQAKQKWPQYTLKKQEYLDIGNSTTDIKLTAKKGLRAKRVSFWLDYVPYLMNNAANNTSPDTNKLTSVLVIALAVCTAVFASFF